MVWGVSRARGERVLCGMTVTSGYLVIRSRTAGMRLAGHVLPRRRSTRTAGPRGWSPGFTEWLGLRVCVAVAFPAVVGTPSPRAAPPPSSSWCCQDNREALS